MSGEAVPEDDGFLSTIEMMQLREPEDKVVGHGTSGKDGEEKLRIVSWRHGKHAEAGLRVARKAFTQERWLPGRSPRFSEVWRKREAAFVHENQRDTELLLFFLMRGQTFRRQRSTSSSECLSGRTVGFR